MDPDLVQAAAESQAPGLAELPTRSVEAVIANLRDDKKTALLLQLSKADPYVGAELQLLLRHHLQFDEAAARPPSRSVAALRARAEEIRLDRARAKTEAMAAQRKRDAEKAEKQRRTRLDALARRGDAVWREIEAEINRRNASGYAKAVSLLSDMKTLAAKRGLVVDFDKYLAAIRERHAQKDRFIERLTACGL
jgi:hypothetical protein